MGALRAQENPMRNAALALTLSIVVPGLIVAACKKKEEEPPPQQGGYGQPGYGQPGYGQPQPGYGQPGQGGYAGTGAAGAPAGTATGGQPAPMAFPCSSDATCGLHKCNMQVGRCQWPCQTNEDCQAGAACMTPFCMPGGGTAPAPTR